MVKKVWELEIYPAKEREGFKGIQKDFEGFMGIQEDLEGFKKIQKD